MCCLLLLFGDCGRVMCDLCCLLVVVRCRWLSFVCLVTVVCWWSLLVVCCLLVVACCVLFADDVCQLSFVD